MHAVVSLTLPLYLESFHPLMTRTVLQHGFLCQWHGGEQRSEITEHLTKKEVPFPPEETWRQERIKSGQAGT